MKKTFSWDSENQIDCFGNKGLPKLALIWPREKDGADIIENKMLLSEESINQIKDITKGRINNIRYSITKQFIIGGEIYGNMKIQTDPYGGWIEVVKKIQK